MKYYGGCDVGSTYTKAVILDETGKICADTTIRSKINSEVSAKLAMEEVLNKVGLKSSEELGYLIGTGYGRNKVPFADENISEISCHAMGVHVTDPTVKAIIDIGGQDVKGISIDTDGTVKNFAMNTAAVIFHGFLSPSQLFVVLVMGLVHIVLLLQRIAALHAVVMAAQERLHTVEQGLAVQIEEKHGEQRGVHAHSDEDDLFQYFQHLAHFFAPPFTSSWNRRTPAGTDPAAPPA